MLNDSGAANCHLPNTLLARHIPRGLRDGVRVAEVAPYKRLTPLSVEMQTSRLPDTHFAYKIMQYHT
jgi:hypothetical protein